MPSGHGHSTFVRVSEGLSMFKLLCAAIAAIAVAVPACAHAGQSARTASTCSISGKERKLGATYVTSVTASGVACSKAVTFVKAYHSCRHKHGAAGHCAKLQGYTCTERRESIPTQFDAVATCRSGSRKIVQTYTQNT